MFFDTYQFSDPGGREPNEDTAAFFEKDLNSAWIAADGLGGHVSGEIASAEAASALKEFFESESVNAAFLPAAFERMNQRVAALEGPLTTAVAAVTDNKNLYFANNGDSRFLMIRKGKIIARTNDHSMAFLSYKQGLISYDAIRTAPNQNQLLHAMGSETDFSGEFYDPVELKPGDAFLLCTDGFWELLTNEEILRALKGTQTSEQWLNLCLPILIERLKPNSDNYTAVFVRVRA